MPKVGLVVDSTCDLTPQWLAAHDITMVPLTVFFGSESYLDWVELTPEEFYQKLASFPGLPKTSQPSPAAFSEAYAALAEKGCDGIVSIHLSGPLSGTVQSATLAAATSAPVPVHVVDTHLVTQGVALARDRSDARPRRGRRRWTRSSVWLGTLPRTPGCSSCSTRSTTS